MSASRPVPGGQSGTDPAAKSLRNVSQFPTAAHEAILSRGVAFDAHRFRAVFPDRWGAFLRAHFRSATEVQFFFDVSERTAYGWWAGSGGRPTGDAVALAVVAFPAAFPRFLNAA